MSRSVAWRAGGATSPLHVVLSPTSEVIDEDFREVGALLQYPEALMLRETGIL